MCEAKRLNSHHTLLNPQPYLHRPLCPLFNRLFVIYLLGLARYLEPLHWNIRYSDEAGSCSFHTDGGCCNQHSRKNDSRISPKLILFMITKHRAANCYEHDRYIYWHKKYSGAQQFNPFQVKSCCCMHSLWWGHLVIGTVNSIQIHPPLRRITVCQNR